MKRALLAALVILGAACGTDPYAEAVPSDLEEVGLEISNEASAMAQGLESTGATREALSSGPELLALGKDKVQALNDAMRRMVEPLAELVQRQAPQLQPGDVAVYGPRERGGLSYKLTIKRHSVSQFRWKLEAKPSAAGDDAYVRLAGGALEKGPAPHTGRGALGLDLDALRTLIPSVQQAGKLLCGFENVGPVKSLVYGLKNFTPNAASVEPISGVFAGRRHKATGATSVRVHARINLGMSPTTERELVRARIRFIPQVGGRADFIANQGDVPAGTLYLGHACWDAQEREGFAIIRKCSGPLSSPSCEVVAVRGAKENCAIGDESMPPEDVNDASPEPGDGTEGVAPPADIPGMAP